MIRHFLRFALVLAVVASLGFAVPVSAAAAPTTSTTVTAKPTDSPDILVSPTKGTTVAEQLSSRVQSSWPWYITRAAGLVAAVALVLLILSGVGLITGYTFRFLEPLTAWATHRAIGLVFGVSVVVHVVALLFDKYVPFTIAQALLPFVSNYRTVSIAGHHLGSLYVALGVFALYGVIAIILSSLLWIDKKPYIWKVLHLLSYIVMTFVFFHALYLGTDLAHGIFRILWIIFGIAVAVAIIARLRRSKIG